MTGGIEVALAQLRPALRDTARNLATMRRLLEEHADADLVVFPELFLAGYTTAGLGELAVDLGGPEVAQVSRIARETSTAIVFGAAERTEGGVANAAILVDGLGEVVGSYRKTHLFGDEKGAFVAGDELLVVDVGGARAGVMICFDVEFPEVARALAVAGADLLVTVSANMEPFGRDHEVFAMARALENNLPHLYVNQVGQGEEFVFAGGTAAFSADGERLLQATGEEVVQLRLDLGARNAERPEELRPDYLLERRGPLPVVAAGRETGDNRAF